MFRIWRLCQRYKPASSSISYSFLSNPSFAMQVNMMTGTPKMSEKTPYLPVEYADLNPGDMLYNPDWQWHTIRNYEGLSIGVPIREVRFFLLFLFFYGSNERVSLCNKGCPTRTTFAFFVLFTFHFRNCVSLLFLSLAGEHVAVLREQLPVHLHCHAEQAHGQVRH